MQGSGHFGAPVFHHTLPDVISGLATFPGQTRLHAPARPDSWRLSPDTAGRAQVAVVARPGCVPRSSAAAATGAGSNASAQLLPGTALEVVPLMQYGASHAGAQRRLP